MIRVAGRLADGQPFVVLGLTLADARALATDEILSMDLAAPLPEGLGEEGLPMLSVMYAADEPALAARLAALGAERIGDTDG